MNPNEWAAIDFQGAVWPRLKRTFVGGELVPIETTPGRIADDLDADAGIDAYVKMPRGPVQAFAVRIQWRYRPDGTRAPWGKGKTPMTYTIRSQTDRGGTWTELQKRTAAYEDGGLMPTWTLQAYLERPGGDLENVGWNPTDDLYALVTARQKAGVPFQEKTGPRGARFVIVPWLDVGGYRYFRPKPQEFQFTIGEFT